VGKAEECAGPLSPEQSVPITSPVSSRDRGLAYSQQLFSKSAGHTRQSGVESEEQPGFLCKLLCSLFPCSLFSEVTRTYAATDAKGNFVSGRVEPNTPFWKKVARRATFFQKDQKCTMLPQAKPAFESGTRLE
jgi:hypothetical protein